MSTTNRRDLQKQERRNQLLDAARRLFAEKGMDNTTIKDIADMAGVAQGLIYHYFRSKDDIFWAIIARDNPLPAMIDVWANAAGRPAREVLGQVGLRVFALLDEKRDLLRIVAREFLTRSEMQQGFKMIQALIAGVIARYLDARIAAGELRPHNPDVIARMLVGSMLAGYLTGMAAETYVAEVIESLLDGIAADERMAGG